MRKPIVLLLLISMLIISLNSCQSPLGRANPNEQLTNNTVNDLPHQTDIEPDLDTEAQTEDLQDQMTDFGTSTEKEPLIQPATPYYQEYDEFIEAWLHQQAKESGELGLNQTSREYSLIVPVLHHSDYKFRLAEVFESGGYLIEYMPADIEDPLDVAVYINQDTITVKVKHDALLHEEIMNMFLEDPNMVFDNELYMMHLIDVDFTDGEKMFAEDFDLSDYLTFEIRTYTITSETNAIQ